MRYSKMSSGNELNWLLPMAEPAQVREIVKIAGFQFCNATTRQLQHRIRNRCEVCLGHIATIVYARYRGHNRVAHLRGAVADGGVPAEFQR